ncbi:MAG: hypothetical protein ACI841_004097 [Planctomycetota bacterium]|jgi:hypothetical protein
MISFAVSLLTLIPSTASASSAEARILPDLELEIVDSDSGQAIPDAHILWLPDAAQPLNILLENLDPWLFHEEAGVSSTSDQHGRASVTASTDPKSLASVLIHAGQLWAFARLPVSSTAAIRIELEPEREAVAQITDHNGKPAAGISILLQSGTKRRFRRSMLTDEQGRAHFRRLRAFDGFEPGDDAWELSLANVISVEAPTKLRIPSGEETLLKRKLPALGSLTVQVEGSDGKPYLDTGLVQVRPLEWPEREQAATPLQHGQAHFSRIAIGTPIEVHAWTAEHGERLFEVQPLESAGEQAHLRVTWEAAVPILLGRLMGPEQTPLVGIETSIQLGSTYLSVMTGFDGRFRQPLSSKRSKDWQSATLASFETRPASREVAPMFGSCPVRITGRAGELDLGSITLDPMELVASGRIVMPDGSPLEGPPELSTLLTGKRAGSSQDSATAEPSRAGKFWLYAPDAGGIWDLRFLNYSQIELKDQQVSGGSRDLLLRTYRPTDFHGRLLVSEHVPAKILTLRFTSEGHKLRPRIESDGSFELRGLRHGSYTVTVTGPGYSSRAPVLSFGDRGPLASIEDVQVDEEGRCSDPRVMTIDLRHRFFAFPLQVQDREGGAIPVSQVAIGNGVKSPASLNWSGGTLYSNVSQLDLYVQAPGYRSQVLRGVSGAIDVQLQKGIAQRFDLPAQLGLETPENTFKLAVTRKHGPFPAADVRSEEHISKRFRGNEVMLLHLPGEGVYVLQLWLGNRDLTGLLTRGALQHFEVSESPAQPVGIEVLPEWLDAARKELGD